MVQRSWPAITIPIAKLPKFEIKVRSLGSGEAAMFPMRMESDRGVDTASGAALYARAAPIAARFPNDAAAQAWFAEIAHDAQQFDAADAAADRALAVDPSSSQALVYRARNAMRRAQLAKAPPGSPLWKSARSWILRANRISNNDADALSLFYFSFIMAGETPTPSSKKALQRALELVPQDPSLRYSVVRQHILDDQADLARRVLLPLAYSAHVSADSRVRQLLSAIDAKQPAPALLAIIDAKSESDYEAS
jgi:tetratricopeptide (TPR) repeat protein